jgi:UDP-N-acetylmuramoylalanine--D-glutamate ligase
MTAPTLTAREPDLRGLRVLVVGLGTSGLAAARLAVARGGRVTVADQRDEAALGEAAAAVRRLGAALCDGGNPPELAGEADLIVVSPGVPWESPLLAKARGLGVPVWGEVELAARYCRGRIVGITGSNGKSTTTSMAGTILRSAGVPGGTGGNLGTPLADLLAFDAPDAVHAVELSSFQLEHVEAMRPFVAVVLNLSPDHLDRYAAYEDYARAKARLLELQRGDQHAVLNADDPESERFVTSVRGVPHRFSTRKEVERGAFVRGGRIVLRTDACGEEEVMDASALPVPGEHNLANALAAALACRLAGVAPEDLSRGLGAYRSLPHRLEKVAELDGVNFYNDSKATNLDATARALEAFPAGKVHLIAGGKDKGADWSTLEPLVRRHVRRLLLIGRAAPAIRKGLSGAATILDCGTVREAVRQGYERAAPGDVVLLAPGCASFDQYRNFEERGRDFVEAVEALRRSGGRRA